MIKNSYKHYGRDFSECISNEQRRFAKYLEDHYIRTSYEFPLGYKSYDIFIPNRNCFIEVDPSYTHNSTNKVLLKGKSRSSAKTKTYHYNKTKFALEKGFYCLHKFDWITDREMIQQIRNIHRYSQIQEDKPRLHWYNIKTGEHQEDFKELLNKSYMVGRGFVEIYDDGTILNYKKERR